MMKLVQSIEKYPPIYNNKRHYCKDDIDHAWDRVALEVGEKGKSFYFHSLHRPTVFTK